MKNIGMAVSLGLLLTAQTSLAGKLPETQSLKPAIEKMNQKYLIKEGGSGTSGGGNGVNKRGGAYDPIQSLDLVELGLEDSAYVIGDITTLHPKLAADETLCSLRINQSTSQGEFNVDMKFVDTKGLKGFFGLLEKSPEFYGRDKEDSVKVQLSCEGTTLPPVTYNSKVIKVAVILNKLYQIRAAAPEMADALFEKLKSFTWKGIDLPLKYQNDAKSVIDDSVIVQVAVRRGHMITFSNFLFNNLNGPVSMFYTLEDAKKFDQAKNNANYNSNRVALIFHEAVYAITAEQGDTDSRRAREINAYLFMDSDQEKFIQEANDLLFERK